MSLPNNEVKLRKGEHHNSQKGRECPVDNWSEHVLQRHHGPLVTIPNATNKALKED